MKQEALEKYSFGVGDRFAQFLKAARQAPLADSGRLASADEQHLVVLEDDDTHPGKRAIWIVALIAHAVFISRARKPDCPNRRTFWRAKTGA